MITFLAAIVVLASIGMVSWPLVRGIGGRNGPRLVEDTEVSEMLAQKDATLFAISELESDYNMGNLSQGDYRELRQKYEEKAVALLKTVDELRSERGLDTVTSIDEEIESRVSSLRAAKDTGEPDVEAPAAKMPVIKRGGRGKAISKPCPGCGAQLEVDDLFCFRCGAALSAKCPKCSAEVDADDQFCFHCGAALNTGGNRGAK